MNINKINKMVAPIVACVMVITSFLLPIRANGIRTVAAYAEAETETETFSGDSWNIRSTTEIGVDWNVIGSLENGQLFTTYWEVGDGWFYISTIDYEVGYVEGYIYKDSSFSTYEEGYYSVATNSDNFSNENSISMEESENCEVWSEEPESESYESSYEEQTIEQSYVNDSQNEEVFTGVTWNIRSTKDFQCDWNVIGCLYTNDRYTVHSTDGNGWYYISTTNVEGYIYKDYEYSCESVVNANDVVAEYDNDPYVNYSIDNTIQSLKEEFPDVTIACGVYTRDGTPVYTTNEYLRVSAACTVKAAYALFVLKRCQELNIDIYNTYLTYEASMYNGGSGTIARNYSPGAVFSIYQLVERLLTVSDNTAYNILLYSSESSFDIWNFQQFLYSIGGAELYGCQYGGATVHDRAAEWHAIWDYIESGERYAATLESILYNVQYGYVGAGMYVYNMHKSGWICDSYPSFSGDAGIYGGKYVIVVFAESYGRSEVPVSILQRIGSDIQYSLF